MHCAVPLILLGQAALAFAVQEGEGALACNVSGSCLSGERCSYGRLSNNTCGSVCRRLALKSESCGGFLMCEGDTCADGLYCDYSGNDTRIPDLPGVCATVDVTVGP